MGETWRRHLTRSRGVTEVWVGPQAGGWLVGLDLGVVGREVDEKGVTYR